MTIYREVFDSINRLYTRRIQRVTIADVMAMLPKWRYRQIWRALNRMVKAGLMVKVCEGRYNRQGYRPTNMASVVYRTLHECWRRTDDCVRTKLIAELIGYGDKVVQRTLVAMETCKLVARKSERSGWLPYRAYQPESLISLVAQGKPITSTNLATVMNISPRHARRLLSQSPLLARQGYHDGYRTAA